MVLACQPSGSDSSADVRNQLRQTNCEIFSATLDQKSNFGCRTKRVIPRTGLPYYTVLDVRSQNNRAGDADLPSFVAYLSRYRSAEGS